MIETCDLMDHICNPSNLNHAFRQVKRNKGAAGVDRKTIAQTDTFLKTNQQGVLIREQLLLGSYTPSSVLGVKIPKPDGGERQLGIPTLVDRWIQQSITQVLTRIYEPKFSNASFGFRPKRSAHDALRQAKKYVAEDRCWVVDIDLARYFDTVNHDRLMARLSQDIDDKRVLRLIRRYLQSGMMQDGVSIAREQGTPQGGPLSPLLANIVLDELDKELESRGHAFVRYADDVNIYVKSKAAGERLLASLKDFLEKKLRLEVNMSKSACALVSDRQFLGYRLSTGGELRIAPKSLSRMKRRVRELTYRNKGQKLEFIIFKLTQYLRGWFHYFKYAQVKKLFTGLDQWIRRRLRCYRLKQRKRCYPIVKWLKQFGVSERLAWNIGRSSKGWWRLSKTPTLNHALPNEWFREKKLFSLLESYEKLKV